MGSVGGKRGALGQPLRGCLRSLRHKPRSGLPLCGCAGGTTHTRVGDVSRRKAAGLSQTPTGVVEGAGRGSGLAFRLFLLIGVTTGVAVFVTLFLLCLTVFFRYLAVQNEVSPAGQKTRDRNRPDTPPDIQLPVRFLGRWEGRRYDDHRSHGAGVPGVTVTVVSTM